MKKTRGKRKTNSYKKKRRFFLMNNKVSPVAVFIAFLAIAVLIIFANHATGNVASSGTQTCGRIGGVFCDSGTCSGDVVRASDTLNCCLGTCSTALPGNTVNNGAAGAAPTVSEGTWYSLVGDPSIATLLQYIFGLPVALTGVNVISAMIVTIAVWLLLFFTFGDIIKSFSTFSAWVSWVIGFLMALIAANIGAVVKIVIVCTQIFIVFGTISIYLGLGVAFIAFIAINIGIGTFAQWAIRRRAAMTAHRVIAGGKETSAVIAALTEFIHPFKKASDQ